MSTKIKIQDIQRTKKGFYSLFCENGFLFSVEDILLVTEKIEIGSCFTQQELTLIYEKSQTARAVSRGYNFLSFRRHSKQELYKKLSKYYDSDCCSAVILKLEGQGLLNDDEFCRDKLEYLIEKKNMSLPMARLHLLTLGIDKAIIEEYLQLYEEKQTHSDSLTRLIATKYKSKLSDSKKVTQSLMRRGFSYYDIKRALENINIEIEEEFR